jgi:hypothetical protein
LKCEVFAGSGSCVSSFFLPHDLRPCPGDIYDPSWFADVLSNFETFWDSETPRVGEDGANGWLRWQTSSLLIPSSAPIPVPVNATTDPFDRWLEAERQAERFAHLPGRATDLDANDEDPYRVILFSDIEPLLFPIQDQHARLQLANAFFDLLGVSFGVTSSSKSSPPDPFWTMSLNGSLRQAFWPTKPEKRPAHWRRTGDEAIVPEIASTLAQPFNCPAKNWATEPCTLFSHPDTWFRNLDPTELTHVNIGFTRYVYTTDKTDGRNVMQSLRPLLTDSMFLLESIALEHVISPKL